MAETQLSVGLKKQDQGDPSWDSGLNSGFDDANSRLTVSGAGDPNGVVAGHWVGQAYWDTTALQQWYCTTATGVAATSVWQSTQAVVESLTFLSLATGTLVASGGVTAQSTLDIQGAFTAQLTAAITGLLTASGGVSIPTLQTLLGPNAEEWISNGFNTMDPLNHKVRHNPGGQDEISVFSSRSSVTRNDSPPQPVDNVIVDHITVSKNFSGRSGNSRVVVIAFFPIDQTGAGPRDLPYDIVRDATVLDSTSASNIAAATDDTASGLLLAIDNAVPNAITVDFKFRSGPHVAGSQVLLRSALLAILDLGPAI